MTYRRSPVIHIERSGDHGILYYRFDDDDVIVVVGGLLKSVEACREEGDGFMANFSGNTI